MGNAVLKSASVWAAPGQITVLLGRNGCGKTTLFRAALGLVARDFGTVRFGSRTFQRPRLHELSRIGLFFLPDSGLLSRRHTLGRHVSFLRSSFPGEARDRFPAQLGLNKLWEKTVWQMSGGEERRAELALAWCRRPSCLLADEPLAGLAPKDQESIAGVLRTLADEGCALVLTGHDVRPLMEVADRIVWMVAGTTHGIGSPEDGLSLQYVP